MPGGLKQKHDQHYQHYVLFIDFDCFVSLSICTGFSLTNIRSKLLIKKGEKHVISQA